MRIDDEHRILIVDDDAATRDAHARLVRRMGYRVETASDGLGALELIDLGFDLLMVDGEMPNMDGFELAERVRANPAHEHLPIVMVTGMTDDRVRRRALEVGVNDFFHKPVDAIEVELRTKWLLRLKGAHDRLSRHREDLEREVERRTEHLRATLERIAEAERSTRRAHADTVRRLMIAAEHKDADTAGHIERIGLYSGIVSQGLGMPPQETELIRRAAPMHDVGKIGIPDSILLKPGRLDDAEWEVMRSHTSIGESILAGSDSPLIRLGERIAASHHEKWDGSGYPRGLSGEDIPVEGRICAVVDYFDALSMDRPYRSAVPVDEVLEMMKGLSGSHFDPTVLDVFLDRGEEIEEARQTVH